MAEWIRKPKLVISIPFSDADIENGLHDIDWMLRKPTPIRELFHPDIKCTTYCYEYDVSQQVRVNELLDKYSVNLR